MHEDRETPFWVDAVLRNEAPGTTSLAAPAPGQFAVLLSRGNGLDLGRGSARPSSYRKVVFMSWLWLFLAIALDVAATVCQKLSNGFTRPLSTVLMAVLYGGSLLPMSLALRRLEVATAYAIWSAAGTALVTMIGMVVFKEAATPLKCGAIVLIVAGVVCLNVASGQSERASRRAAEARKASPVLSITVSSGTAGVATTKTDEASARLVRVAGERK